MATKPDIDDILRTLGERVKSRRKALALTQEKLAEAVNLSPTYLAKLEAGKKTPSLETVVVLAQVLDVDAADLIRNRQSDKNEQTAANIADALSGMSDREIEFIEEETLRLSAFLRTK